MAYPVNFCPTKLVTLQVDALHMSEPLVLPPSSSARIAKAKGMSEWEIKSVSCWMVSGHVALE